MKTGIEITMITLAAANLWMGARLIDKGKYGSATMNLGAFLYLIIAINTLP